MKGFGRVFARVLGGFWEGFGVWFSEGFWECSGRGFGIGFGTGGGGGCRGFRVWFREGFRADAEQPSLILQHIVNSRSSAKRLYVK